MYIGETGTKETENERNRKLKKQETKETENQENNKSEKYRKGTAGWHKKENNSGSSVTKTDCGADL